MSPLPPEFIGVWERVGLVVDGKSIDNAGRSCWFQADEQFLDFRAGSEGTQSEAFLGVTAWDIDSTSLKWRHVVDMHEQARDDVGRVEWEGDDLIPSLFLRSPRPYGKVWSNMSVIEPAAHLSAQARDFLRDPPEPLPPVDYSNPEDVQAFREKLHPEWAALADDLTGSWVSRGESIAGVDVVRFAASEDQLDNSSALIHLHGGSYLFGSPSTNAALAVPMAQRTGLPVVSVDYRLGPEHQCPAAIDDATAVHRELSDKNHIVGLYGESAGGGLALATAVALRDAGDPLPDRLGLISPWVDLTCSGDTYRTMLHVDPDFADPNDPPAMAAAYAGDRVDTPEASPLFADLSGLPPTLIQVGGREVLLSDSCRLDASLRKTGVASTLDVWDGLWHVWHVQPELPETVLAFDELAAFFSDER